MRVVLNSFHLENAIFAKKKSQTFAEIIREIHVYLPRYMLAKIVKKNMDVWYPQIVPGVWSLVTLHSAAAALKHLRSALRCCMVFAHLHRPVLTQQVHSLGHLAFEGRPSFAKALAKLSPNFREKNTNSFYKMKYIYILHNKQLSTNIYNANLDMCTWIMNFRQNFSQNKLFLSPFQKKTLAETVNCIPKGLRKGNPFQGPFAQLSYNEAYNHSPMLAHFYQFHCKS